jgi:hypothetical protein
MTNQEIEIIRKALDTEVNHKDYVKHLTQAKTILNKQEAAISVTRCSTQFVCEHRWTHNTHSDTKYCSKGCDGFKIHEAN